MIEPGQQAPDFELPDQGGNPVKPAEHDERVLKALERAAPLVV